MPKFRKLLENIPFRRRLKISQLSTEPNEPDGEDTNEMPHDSSHYPEPLVVEPASGCHKQSWIVLHGRGDTAKGFATGMSGFLNMPLLDGGNMQQHLPDARFIFPTASYRRAKRFNRRLVTQWFDVYSWSSTEHTDWQIEGLRETTAWIHELMRREIAAVGAENVVLGGLSQGCASALISLLLWEGQNIKALFGMSGWLPFQHVLRLAYQTEGEKQEGEVVFEQEGQNATPSKERDVYQEAVGSLCLELELDKVKGEVAKRIPILIAHGGEDNTVDTQLGRDAVECLQKLGCNVVYKEYATLVHWMRSDEFSDIVDFVNAQGPVSTKVS